MLHTYIWKKDWYAFPVLLLLPADRHPYYIFLQKLNDFSLLNLIVRLTYNFLGIIKIEEFRSRFQEMENEAKSKKLEDEMMASTAAAQTSGQNEPPVEMEIPIPTPSKKQSAADGEITISIIKVLKTFA